jgi:uncharacterized protein YceK
MKNLFILFLLALVILNLSGCADFSTPTTTSSSSSEGVAGEKTSGVEDRVGAGLNGTTPSAQVKW